MEHKPLMAQKMESIGHLAAGVAHYFNNMLGAIQGYADLAMMQLDAATPIQHELQQILKVAERSTAATEHLLAFAGKQSILPEVLDLNQTIEGMLRRLYSLVGKGTKLVWRPGEEVWPIKMDPYQVGQILSILSLNARDAITGFCKITIETGTANFDELNSDDYSGFNVGDFVTLAVSDNGQGMDEATQAKIFKPFFSTKSIGYGVGLGLAAIYGIVRQNNGFINVYSKPGHGSTFKVYLPRYI